MFAKHLLCRHTPFKIKTLVSCIRFLLVFLCGCSLVRVTTRWWTLMVATHLLPLCLGESVFPWGFFRCCPLRSFPCALVPQGLPPWGVVVQGNSGGITFFARYPLGHFLIVSCRIPFSCFGGGGGENILLSFIIMHSCNPNDRFDL